MHESQTQKLDVLEEVGKGLGGIVDELRQDHNADQRWVSIGATHLQEGLMSLRRAITRPQIFVVVLALFLTTACAAKPTNPQVDALTTGLLASGELMTGAGNAFVAAGAVYAANCALPMEATAPSTTQAFCQAFRAFAVRFQPVYAQAVAAWSSALAANNASAAQASASTVAPLASELSGLLTMMPGVQK